MDEKLATALHEAAVYGIGGTSDHNQKIILQAAQDAERLREALVHARRSMWLIVRGHGPCTIEMDDIASYPGDDHAHLLRSDHAETGGIEFRAIELDGDPEQSTRPVDAVASQGENSTPKTKEADHE